jgi:hypothetical protein
LSTPAAAHRRFSPVNRTAESLVFSLLATTGDSSHCYPSFLWSRNRSTPWPWYSSPESLPHHPFIEEPPHRRRAAARPLLSMSHTALLPHPPPNRQGHLSLSPHVQELNQGSHQPPHHPTSLECRGVPMSSARSNATSHHHTSVLVTMPGRCTLVLGAL